MPKNTVSVTEGLEKEYTDRIANRKLLKDNESVVYRMMNQALKENEVSHAYLFSGPEGCLKKEAGILFAQSILLEENALIHEEELNEEKRNIASRIATLKYPDFIYLNGYRKEAISKDEISEIQSLFSKTSVEKGSRKLYLIDCTENMSISAMNALLKFLEEPEENVYAILTTDHIDKLLPTVISRCVLVPFHPLKKETCLNVALQEGIDEEDAFLLTRVVSKTKDYMSIVVSNAYQNAKTMLKQYIGVKGNPRLLLVDYDVRYKVQVKDTDGNDETDVSANRIAPGTQGSFDVELENASEVTAKYTVTFESQNASNIPVEFSVDGGTTWKTDIEELTLTDVLEAGAKTSTTESPKISWRWIFERGTEDSEKTINNENDTALGTAKTAPTVTVTAHLVAEQVD